MQSLISGFKKYFVPCEENDYQPRILSFEIVAFLIAVVIMAELAFLFGASYFAPGSRLFGVILINALVDGTNQNRIVGNLPVLRVNPLLQAAAQKKADDMAKNGYFAHTSPAGITPWHWFEEVGYEFSYAGENLAANFSDSADVTNAWMNSPGHRANIMSGNFTEIGIAAAEGEYQGRPTTYVVELFGTPLKAVELAQAGAPPQKISEPQAAKAAVKPVAKPKKAAPKVITRTVSSSPGSQELFVAVKGAEAEPAPSADISPVAPQNNPVQRAAANPKRLVNSFYFLLAVLFIFTLALNFVMKLHRRHPKLIFGGASVAVLAISFIVLNQYLAFPSAAIL